MFVVKSCLDLCRYAKQSGKKGVPAREAQEQAGAWLITKDHLPPTKKNPHLVLQIIFLGVQPPKIILKITDLIRFAHANPVCLRTQENNFGSKYVENISRLFWKRPATGK